MRNGSSEVLLAVSKIYGSFVGLLGRNGRHGLLAISWGWVFIRKVTGVCFLSDGKGDFTRMKSNSHINKTVKRKHDWDTKDGVRLTKDLHFIVCPAGGDSFPYGCIRRLETGGR